MTFSGATISAVREECVVRGVFNMQCSEEKVTFLTKKEFEALGEYSCTLPSGTTIGRRWKKNNNAYAWVGWAPCAGGGVVLRHYWCAMMQPPEGARKIDWADWDIGEFYDIGNERKIGIRWTKPCIR